MITENYCSYEVAKLLKEKGFDGDGGDCECHMFYSSYSKMIMPITEIGLVSDFDEIYYAPTHQMAMKWLREKHNICITIYPDVENGYEAVLYNIENNVEIVLQSFGIYGIHIYKKIYEEAVETALKYCLGKLKLI